ncbi:MAG: HNH endonuclease [Clostridia bacterium]|nr:HNH endonuclease [Clostridia bacterium]
MKLNFELIPDGCWYSNLRTVLKPKHWDILRKDAYKRAQGKCMICGRKVTRLEAHERWDFNEQTKVQKLTEIIAVCHLCHSVIHIGRTQLMGEEDKAIAHYQRVNNCNYATYRKNLGEANLKHQRLSRVDEWILDISALKEIIGNIDL